MAGALVGYIVFPRVTRLMLKVLSFLSTLLFLRFYSFVDVLSQLLMSLRVFGIKGLLRLGGMLCCRVGELYAVMVLAVPFLLFTLGMF